MAVCVANTDNIPNDLLNTLSSHGDIFKCTKYIDNLLEIPTLLEVVKQMNAHCEKEGVIGFHFTRADSASIEKDGLVIRSGLECRNWFIREYGHLFTDQQRWRMKQAWDSYFTAQQNQARNGRICFTLTHKPLQDGGADRLLRYFGGEVIYMPLVGESDIACILQNLGEPLIVQCVLDTKRLMAFHEFPWGAVWLSSYHCALNPTAYQYDQDISTLYSIPASDIISITNAHIGL